MATYLITYDVTRLNESAYPELLKALEADGAVRILFSEWLVASDLPAAAVRDRYHALMDEKDGLFVCSIVNWAFVSMQNEGPARKLLP